MTFPLYSKIKSESFLEDLNNILNSGDVPNIYQGDELEQIFTAMKSVVSEAGLPPTKTNLYSAYTKRVRQNLHSVICMRFDIRVFLRAQTDQPLFFLVLSVKFSELGFDNFLL